MGDTGGRHFLEVFCRTFEVWYGGVYASRAKRTSDFVRRCHHCLVRCPEFVDRKRYSKVRDHLHKRTVRLVSVVFLHSAKSLLEVFFGWVVNDEMVVGEILKARFVIHAENSIGFCMILVDLSRHEFMHLFHQRIGRNAFFRAEIDVI
jgi:hypothetical protein